MHLPLFLELMEDMLELEGTSQTLVELYISQSVRPKLMLKLNLGTSMADMEFITLVPL